MSEPRYKAELRVGEHTLKFWGTFDSVEQATAAVQEVGDVLSDAVVTGKPLQAKISRSAPKIIAELKSPLMEQELTEDGFEDIDPELPMEFIFDGFADIHDLRLNAYLHGLRELYPNIDFSEWNP